MLIERTTDADKRKIEWALSSWRYAPPRGVVFRADGTLTVDDAASGVIEVEEQA